MTVYLQDPDVTVHCGDVLDVLPTLPDGSVDCVVTSPPYWGLRDYGTGEWEGGDPECEHVERMARRDSGRLSTDTRPGINPAPVDTPLRYRNVCHTCGARRVDRQIGLEQSFDEYVSSLVGVFREVRRVLAPHGTCWLNLGDSYAASRSYQVTDSKHRDVGNDKAASVPTGMKPKDLIGMPWTVAFALRDDGWYLRSCVIWAKPNPMPESVTDRPTTSHEYVFLLTKQARYFYDADAVREPHVREWGERNGSLSGNDGKYKDDGTHWGDQHAVGRAPNLPNPAGRNLRSVWQIPTQPYPEAHFATYPEDLVRRCIAAGCPEGGTVLDPFLGSGTTAHVARKLGRKCVGIELNPDYCKLVSKRLAQLSLLAEPAA